MTDDTRQDRAAEGASEVAYRRLPSPVGTLLLAATDRGLVHVAFECEPEEEVLAMLARKIGPRVHHAPAQLDEAARRIDSYLSAVESGDDGSRVETPELDPRLASGFRGEVQRALADIPWGSTVTYKDLAGRLGRPGAVRAVGTACATNPLPLVWPCHRVLRSDGGPGGFRGGLEVKSWLLEHEAGAS